MNRARSRNFHLPEPPEKRVFFSQSTATKKACRILLFALAGIMGLALGPAQKSIPQLALVMEGVNVRLQPQVDGLRDGLEELKYVRGENLEWKLVEGETQEELRSKLKALIQLQKVGLLVTLGSSETAIAKETAANIPTVFLPAADPIKSGFVRSLARPGTNITGLTSVTDSQSLGKQLEVYKQVVPSVRKLWIVFDDRMKSAVITEGLNRLAAVAAWLGIELAKQPVTSIADASRKIASFPSGGGDSGVFLVCSNLFKDLEVIASITRKRKMPLFGCNAFQVAEQNVLLSYGPDLYSLGYRGAWFVDRIFKGARPHDVPVETARKFELVINNKVAEEVGLKIAPEMLMLADRVFK
jgi:putative tryptophan/tyrosine transport system substrate-binding protein